MSKITLFIFFITIIATLNSCHKKKCIVYYAYCETSHALWVGNEFKSNEGPAQPEASAHTEANTHDNNIHGGIRTASVRREYRQKIVCK